MVVVTGINAASSFLWITPNKNICVSSSRSVTEASLHSVLFSSRSSIDTLQQQIIQGATLKMMKRDDRKPSPPLMEQNQKEIEVGMDTPSINQYTYYVREARRSEINDITDILMASFHSQSQQPTFDSYIKRYKSNHLRMCFDAFDESDRGIFVACASPTSGSICTDEETLVGFCLVDGRTPDPSCQIEFLTPSTLEATSPRPYLSDLGVIPSHRRRGLGELLVQACETWAVKRGYDKMYLKVEESNKPGVRLYHGMRYERTKLPWTREMNNEERSCTMLLEKSLASGSPTKRRRKRTWIKEQLLEPVMHRLGNKTDSNKPPL